MKKIPKNYYDENFIYMKGFVKINITKICKDLNLSRPMITSGNGTKQQYEKVRREIEKEVAKLYLK